MKYGLYLIAGFLLGAAVPAEPSVSIPPGASGDRAEEGARPLVVRAARLYRGDGTLLNDGGVLVVEGRIQQVGTAIEVPEGARSFQPEGTFSLTPGLVDAAAQVGLVKPEAWAEQGSEVIPHLRNLDAVDLDDPAFTRRAAEGVTTVFVTPDPSSVIGCRGTILKTAGPAASRVMEPLSQVKANLGPEAWRRGTFNRAPRGAAVDYRTRRPTTRMGSTWVFRKAFFDARAYRDARKGGHAAAPDPDLEVLLRVLDGRVRLRFQAREDIDIWSALRLGDEFGLSLVIEEGTEAYRCIPELKAHGTPVVFGPLFVAPRGARARSGEPLRPCPGAPRLLAEAGVPFALTAADLDGEDGLPRQAGYAVRWGLSLERALRAVTLEPARILGIADRVGDLAPGLDGDLVLWKGIPFAPDARPVLVVIRGEVVFRDETWFPSEGS